MIMAFLGAYVLLLVGLETSSYEISIHPVDISLLIFSFGTSLWVWAGVTGLGICSWIAQFGCIHRAWLLVKYKKILRSDLDFTYNADSDEAALESKSINYTKWKSVK
jgi:hypothetical protein